LYRIGIDVGGTFTDFVLFNISDGSIRFWKVPSTPVDPSIAIGEGLAQLLERFAVPAGEVEFLGHGTTVATNMILERRGSPIGLLTTRGFRDVLAIGRQTRPALYDYSIRKPAPLVERYRRREISERLDSDGLAIRPVDAQEVERSARELVDSGVEAIAICFIHAYRNPAHEEAARDIVRRALPGVEVTISSEVLPEFREYERTSTTVLNAYVLPRMQRYLSKLRARVAKTGIDADLLTVHSNGGLVSLETVERLPVLTCVSGPAAGVVGAAQIGQLLGLPNLITFDVGGTSTDVSLIAEGRPQFTTSREIDGNPLHIPMVDIHVIGAGGGSIARVDAAGAVKVGPQSAGATPGPAAYARGGTAPTLADANIALQRLNPIAILDGQMPVDRSLAETAIRETVGEPAGLSVEAAAYGMIQIATAHMCRAIRAISVEHGRDLKEFVLVAFGGAGPLHAAEVAAECGIARVLIPQEPGTMCARGVLMSSISLDFVRTQLTDANSKTWAVVRDRIDTMIADGDKWLAREHVPMPRRSHEITLDARYRGQTHEIPVRIELADADGLAVFLESFRVAHKREHGYDIPGRTVEFVNLRVRAIGAVSEAPLAKPAGGRSLEEALIDTRPVYFGESGWVRTPVYRRGAIPAQASFRGPAVIEEMSSTTVILPGQEGRLDTWGNILIETAHTVVEA
jgi:N-methylhydantoinase A